MRLEPLLLLGLSMACGTSAPDERDVSAKARVVPKGGEVWGRELSRGLGLAPWEICKELGTLDCISDAHLVTLGGVEPERLGIDEPLPNALVSAPIAVDRVAIAACGTRLERDRSGEPVIFGPVLEDDDSGARGKVATALVERLLSREATPDDLANLESLHAALSDVSSDLTRDWALGACVVVATSTEALFY